MDKGQQQHGRFGVPPIKEFIALSVGRWIQTPAGLSGFQPEAAIGEARNRLTRVVHRWFSRQSYLIKGAILSSQRRLPLMLEPEAKAATPVRLQADPDVQPHPLTRQLVGRLSEKYGPPKLHRPQVTGWTIRKGFDVIAQTDLHWGTCLWLPWPLQIPKNYLMNIFEPGQKRHAGSRLLPSLAEGQAALCFKVCNKYHVWMAMKAIEQGLESILELNARVPSSVRRISGKSWTAGSQTSAHRGS